MVVEDGVCLYEHSKSGSLSFIHACMYYYISPCSSNEPHDLVTYPPPLSREVVPAADVRSILENSKKAE
jgi:hypothetical protein